MSKNMVFYGGDLVVNNYPMGSGFGVTLACLLRNSSGPGSLPGRGHFFQPRKASDRAGEAL